MKRLPSAGRRECRQRNREKRREVINDDSKKLQIGARPPWRFSLCLLLAVMSLPISAAPTISCHYSCHHPSIQWMGPLTYSKLQSRAGPDISRAFAIVGTCMYDAWAAYVNYSHTCYPAHQIKVNGAVVYSYQPLRNDPDYLFQCLTLHNGTVTGQTSSIGVPTQ